MLNADFDIDIGDVCALLDLTVRHQNAVSMDVDCPFCNNGRKGKLNINFAKGVYRCNYNPEHCGGTLSLYARYYNISTEQARAEIQTRLQGGDVNRKAYHPPAQNDSQPPSKQAGLDVRHHTYTQLLHHLNLTNMHEKALLSRGLTPERIRQNEYRSVPAFGCTQLAQSLYKKGCQLDGVPGFYQLEDGRWTIKFSLHMSGILIPIRWIDGRIQGFQIRLDQPMDGAKYIWLSSIGKPHGTGSGSPAHFVGDPNAAHVYLTEGGLKGDVTNCLAGITLVCTAGVNNQKSIEPMLQELKQRGLKGVVEANDMDKLESLICRENYSKDCGECTQRQASYGQKPCPHKLQRRKNIQRGCKKAQRVCCELGLSYQQLVWDMDKETGEWAGHWKGIDDFQYHCKIEQHAL